MQVNLSYHSRQSHDMTQKIKVFLSKFVLSQQYDELLGSRGE